MNQRHLLALVAIVFWCGPAGCNRGPDLGTVRGTVKVNGQVLPHAYVVFQPIDPPGAYGSAYADDQGEYDLQFSRHRNGAPVGKHRVSIRAANRDELPEGSPAAATIKLPAKYNSETELIREVVPGHNDHDFDLQAPAIISARR